MNDEQKNFTVQDRRHFNSEGGSRAETPPVVPASAGADSHPDLEPGPEPSGVPAALDFTGLLLSLAAQAGNMLSQENRSAGDLEAARGIISLLETLKQKTQGNRTADEDAVLDGLLYQLRMAYMTVARGPAVS